MKPGATPSSARRERILVADDEELVRMAIKAILSIGGYDLTMAEDGAEAVEKFREASPRFDLVVLDMHMPRLDGHGALLRIREIDSHARVVLLSGGLHDFASEGVTGLEGVAFLHKPFDNEELLGLVRQILDSRRAPG
ncbi:MAG TPA: response regulator [Verrucomicrobiae bacterium]|nr:response regulator [Verrucomicrobiae bacterium]